MDPEFLCRLATDQDWTEVRNLLDSDDLKCLHVAMLAMALKGLAWHPVATKLAERTGLDVRTVRRILNEIARLKT